MAIPGVGKKTAERMVLELADKVAELRGRAAPAQAPAAVSADDVVSALVNLGYRKGEAEKAVDADHPRRRAERVRRLPETRLEEADRRMKNGPSS